LSLIAVADISIILDLPFFRQVFGFVLLTLLPGFLLIQIIRLTKNPLEKVLFLIGLSVSFLMFVPLLMDFAYPQLGIADPISLLPLLTTLSLILASLSFIAYRTGALDFEITAQDLKTFVDTIRNPTVVGAALILALGILGALFIRSYSDSLFSLLSMLGIVAVVVLIAISGRISERFYPLYIFVIALALQYSRSLASPYLYGSDVTYELYLADFIKSIAHWAPNLLIPELGSSPLYGMLTVVFLPNVYSTLLGIDNILVYELVIPFIFAFVPIGLYQLYRTQIKLGSRSAFLSVFFFMSFYAFYLSEPRQDIAVLFLVLAVMLILNRYGQELKRNALLILFVGSLVVSHYSTTYIFLFYFGFMLIGSTLLIARNRNEQGRSGVSTTMAILVVLIALSWYAFTARGGLIIALTTFWGHTVDAFSSELFSSSNVVIARGLGIGVSSLSFTRAVANYWVNATEILITLGLGLIIWQRKTLKINTQFLLLMCASFLLMLMAIALPSVANVITTYRLYSLVLLFLAPCCVFGIETIVTLASGWLHTNRHLARKLSYVALIGVLVPYFLFNYGFIFEITDHPSNYAFLPSQQQSERVLARFHNASWSDLVSKPLPRGSVYAIKWLSSSTSRSIIYTDTAEGSAQLAAYGNIPPTRVDPLSSQILNKSLSNAYFYLGAASVQQGTFLLENASSTSQLQISLYPTLTSGNTIYSNGLAEVRYFP
jgi:uncharacterized membrane protein